VEELRDIPFDLIITVCGHAHEHCPVWFDNGRVLHQGFDDPPQLAKSARTEEEALQHYRQVRDQIEEFVQRLPQLLER
jgi:arsenate reductase